MNSFNANLNAQYQEINFKENLNNTTIRISNIREDIRQRKGSGVKRHR